MMINLKIGFLIVFLINSLCYAEIYSAPLSLADWKVNQSPTSCQLVQRIPLYGHADFMHESGESLRFSINEQRFKPEIVKASLTLEAPPWSHQPVLADDFLVTLDSVKDQQAYARLSVHGESASKMLDALLKGLYPTFSYHRVSLSGVSPEVNVAVSSINFTKKFLLFDHCRKGFLPSGFKQLFEKSLFFQSGSRLLSIQVMNQINNAVRYFKDVQGVSLNIVSDTAMAGNADKKWFLKRANSIEKKLAELGVPKDKIKIKPGVKNALLDKKVIQLSVFGPDALKSIYYRKGNTRLTSIEKKRLELLAQYAEDFLPHSQLVISSHTDSKGKKAKNLKVSQQRAEVIKRYLISQGMKEEKIVVRAYGESRPVKSNRFPKGRSQNRRVNINFVG